MVNQKANVNTKTHQHVYLLILALIVTYGVCFLLRMMEYSAWQASYLQIAGEKLMATHDAYGWLAGAKGINRYSGSPLSELVLLISKVTGLSPGNVGFWLPAIMAPIVVIPIVIFGYAFSQTEASIVPAIMAGTGIGFLLRTRLSFMDTDVYTLFFPVAIGTALAIWLEQKFCREQELDQQQTFNFFLQAILLGLLIKLYLWCYPSGRYIAVALVAMAIVPVILHKSFAHKLLVILALLTLYLTGYGTWKALIWCFALLAFIKVQFNLFQQNEKSLIGFLMLTALFFVYSDIVAAVTGMMGRVLEYAKVKTSIVNSTSMVLPSVTQSIREAQNIDWFQVISKVGGNSYYFWAGVIGFAYAALKRPFILVFLPLLGLSLASVKLGNRFTMYGCVVIGLGLGSGLNQVLIRFRQSLSLRLAAHLILAFMVVWPSYQLMKGIRPVPVLPSIYARTLMELKDKAAHNAILWQWWDYGYAAQYYAERDTFGDGGRHDGPWLYPLARVHATPFPLQANQIMKLEGYDLARQNKKDSGKNVIYLGNPIKTLQEMDPKQAMLFINSLAVKKINWPGNIPEQYLIVSWENLRLAYWISYFGNWDLITGKTVPGKIMRLTGQVKVDLKKGVVINGKQRIPIRGLDLITNTGTKRGVWNNNSILFAVMNQLSNELYLMDATLYRSMLVQMLIGNPEQFKDYFELVVEHYPWTRAYKVK